ncbi:MAG: hypothetical protein IH977_03380 [Nitrospinae bacterium]|nr:hypothetical protein [Nitrospinota bacterium]
MNKHVAMISLFLTGLLGLVSFNGCARAIFEGYHRTLPPPEARLVVWGEHPTAVGATTSWLFKRGYRLVERARLQQVLNEQRTILTHTPEDEARILQVGRLIGAQTIVFVDTNLTKTVDMVVTRSIGVLKTKFDISVTIRGVDVETGEINWFGKAHLSKPATNPERRLVTLTQEALKAAWNNTSN